jgi:hypothetical protein
MEINISYKDILTEELKWNLESPPKNLTISDDKEIKIIGWVISEDKSKSPKKIIISDDSGTSKHDVKISRPDVINAKIKDKKRDDRCGFNFSHQIKGDTCSIGFEVNKKNIWAAVLTCVKSSLIATKNKWLFIDNDKNRSLDQFKGEINPSHEWFYQWEKYMSETTSFLSKNASHMLLIAPSKEEVFPEEYPWKRNGKTLIEHLLERHSEKILWPLEALKQNKYYSYDPAESHWTDYGANIAFSLFLAKIGIDLDVLFKITYKVETIRGDLGDKLVPPISSTRLITVQDDNIEIYDNKKINHGNIKIYTNKAPIINEHLMVFGGSSSNYFLSLAAKIFERVTFLHSTGSVDKELYLEMKPNHVLLQTNQRFLITPPPPFF